MSLFIRFHWRLLRWIIRLSVTTRIRILQIAVSNLRMEFNLPMPGVEDEVDRKLFECVDSYFDHKAFDDHNTEKAPDESYLNWLQQSPVCNDLRRQYFSILYWSFFSQEERCATSKTYQSLYETDIAEISDSDIWSLYVDIRRQWKVTQKMLKESKAQKIDLRLGDLAMTIPLVSAALAISGYIYVTVIYQYFGIDPTRFFSIGDYLGSSLEQISSALIALVEYVAGVIHGYRNQFTSPKYPETGSTIRKWESKILICIGFGMLFLIYWKWEIYSMISGIDKFLVVIMLIAFQTPVLFLTRRYFENAMLVGNSSIVLILFFGGVFISAQIKISEIMSDREDTPFEVVRGDVTYSQENYKIIGSNSRYMFILDRKINVEVLQITSISRITFGKQ